MYMKNTKFMLISLCVSLLMSGCSSAYDDPEPEYLPTTGTSALTCSTEEPVIAIYETKTSALSSMTTEEAITTEEPRPETTYSETTEAQITNEPWYWCWTDYMDIVLDIDDIPSETVVTAELMSPTENFTASTTGRTTASPPETAVSTTVSQETSDTTTKPTLFLKKRNPQHLLRLIALMCLLITTQESTIIIHLPNRKKSITGFVLTRRGIL